MSSPVDELQMYARFTTAFYSFLHRNLTLDEARTIVQTRLRERETNFLHLIERAVYQNPRSAYRLFLASARCEYGDLCNMVQARGLEATLYTLRQNGVHIEFEEFKGRAPISRNGVELPASAHHFDNPLPVKHFYVESGGSTGASMRVPQDLEQNAAMSPNTTIEMRHD